MGQKLKEFDIISVKGDRNKWIDFVSQVKKNKEKVWTVLEFYIDDYLKNNRGKNG